jgi:hypothetical protein
MDVPIFTSSKYVKQNDVIKSQLAKDAGITLIEVPFWWKGDHDALIETIRIYRPDIPLPKTNANPIPVFPPTRELLHLPYDPAIAAQYTT